MPVSKRTKINKRTKSQRKTKTQKGRGDGYDTVEGRDQILTRVAEILEKEKKKINKITLSSNGINISIEKNADFNYEHEHKEINIEMVRKNIEIGNYVKAVISYY